MVFPDEVACADIIAAETMRQLESQDEICGQEKRVFSLNTRHNYFPLKAAETWLRSRLLFLLRGFLALFLRCHSEVLLKN